MAYADSEGVKLFYEDTGNGTPIVFVHEFAGSHLSWEPQIRYFCRRYRCIAFNARGYPPSDVPKNQDQYSQDLAADDIAAAPAAIARASDRFRQSERVCRFSA